MTSAAGPFATPRRGIGPLPIFLAAVAAAALTAYAYWPGLVTWDPVRQYDQALSGAIDDWHPPAMSWVWRQLVLIHPGPLPMLMVQLALFWGGLVMIATAAWQQGRRACAWALLACGLWPPALALMGAILKDCLMTGALLLAVGSLAFVRDGERAWLRVLGVVALVFAATLRFNAFAACVPLFVALLPRAFWRTWPRLLGSGVAATLVFAAAVPASGWLIGAQPSGVQLSLVIFDLGGITEQSGVSVFPEDLGVRDPVRVNHGCYRPNKWDSYSDWVEPECPLGFTAWNDNVDPQVVRPYSVWVRAVLMHPFAYAAHRFHHFAIATRLLPLPDAIERPVPFQTAPNPWGFDITHNAVWRVVDALAVATAHTPLGWPIVFIALALGAFLASWGLPGARLIAPVALSALLFGCGYLIFGVAAELRYHLWTAIGALLATVLLASERQALVRWRLCCLLVPVTLAVVAALGLRVF